MNNEVLSFRGGKYTSLIPFLLMVAGLLGCSAMGLAAMEAFWVVACVCIMLGMVLASDSAKYFDAIIHGAVYHTYFLLDLCRYVCKYPESFRVGKRSGLDGADL